MREMLKKWLASTLAAVLILSQSVAVAQASADSTADPALVGWWKFDEGAGAVANSSAANTVNGVVYGASWSLTGKINGALDFTGAVQHVEIPDTGNILDTGTGNFTYSAWVKTTQTGSVGEIMNRWWDGGTVPKTFMRIKGDGRVWFGAASGGVFREANSGTAINDGQWHHVAGVRDGRTAKIYVDGVEKGTNNFTDDWNLDSPVPLVIGAKNTIGAEQFNGTIDDARVYKRALSAQELLQLAGVAPSPSPSGNPSPTPVTTNIAAGKTATASSTYVQAPGNETDKGNDNNANTWWSAGVFSNNTWYQVDLGDFYDLARIETTLAWNSQYNFNIEVSRDQVNWASVVTRQTNAVSSKTYTDSVTAPYVRYVRLHFPVAGLGGHPAVRELAVFPLSNTPAGAPAADLAVSKAVYTAADSIVVDLGARYDLTGSEVTFASGEGYRVEVSNDNQTWTEAASKASNANAVSADSYSAAAVRYVKVTATDGALGTASLKVYGLPTILDLTPPEKVSDLGAGKRGIEDITLTWTAPREDGAAGGTVVQYDVRYTTSGAIDTEEKWEQALRAAPGLPKAPGAADQVTVTGLTAATVYYFAMRSADEAGNVSPLSNSLMARTMDPDTTAPTAVTDLRIKADSVTPAKLTLQWTTPSDNMGKETLKYDLRYSTIGPITEDNWDDPAHTEKREFEPMVVWNPNGSRQTEFCSNPGCIPVVGYTLGIEAPGTLQEWTVSPLKPAESYWFALKTVDKSGNASLLSNTNVTADTPALVENEVIVTNMFELKDAVDTAPITGRTIVIASPQDAVDGIPGNTTEGYPLVLQQAASWCPNCSTPQAGELSITNKNHITIKGATGSREDVVIQGTGMFKNTSTTTINIRIIGSDYITFKDLTVRDSTFHAFQLTTNTDYTNGSDYFTLDNIVIMDVGEGGVKGTTPGTPNGPYQDYGTIKNSLIGFSSEEIAVDAGNRKVSRNFSFGVEPVSFVGWTIAGNTFENIRSPSEASNGTYAVYTKGASIDFIVENNTFINNFSAISYGDGGNTPIPYKRGWNSEKTGKPYETIGGIIRNNVVQGTVDAPIGLHKAHDVKIYNNTLWGDPDFLLGSIDVRDNASSADIRNNIMNAEITYRGRDASAGVVTVSNNLENASDTLFVNAAGGDFHLKATAYEAIDRGYDVSQNVPTDYEGNARPFGEGLDLGAYEMMSPAGAVRITGPANVVSGDELTVTLSMNSVSSSVYANSVTLGYDPGRLSYIGAQSVAEGYTVLQSTYSSGRITMIGAGLGKAITGSMSLLELKFRVLPVQSPGIASISLRDVQVSDGEGNVTQIGLGPDYVVTVSELVTDHVESLITEAQALKVSVQVHEQRFGHYKQASVDALQASIDKAMADLEQAGSTADLERIAGELEDAMETFRNSANQTKSIGDLGYMAANYGMTSEDANWFKLSMYDIDDSGDLGLWDLTSIASDILAAD